MSNIIKVTGDVVKLEENKFGFYQVNIKGDDGKWHNYVSLGVKKPPRTFKVGSKITVEYDKDDYNNIVEGSLEVVEAEPKPQQKQSGGYNKGGKKPFVDNTIGMGIGAALNNAIQLLNNGKIEEADIPNAVASIYTFSEAAKKAATDGKLAEAMAEYEFSFLEALEEPEPEPEPKPKPKAKKATPKKKPTPKPEPEEDEDFDDDIPF